jgi:hypothetical protein
MHHAPVDTIAEARVGFPFKSHSYSFMRHIDGTVTILPGSAYVHMNRAFPQHVLPLGFVGNLVCVGTILFVVRIIAIRLITRWRVSPGLCVQCRYPLDSKLLKCPECGRLIEEDSTP